MNKSHTLIWKDDKVKESYLLCLAPYKLKLLHEAGTDEYDKTEITVYGSTDDVDRFIEDIDDDSLLPFETLSLEYDDDDEYYSVISMQCRQFRYLKDMDNKKTW